MTRYRNTDDFLGHFNGVKNTGQGQWTALCPAHEDSRASLSLGLKGDRILLNCHAGCDTEDIVRAVGLEMRDLFLDEPSAKHKPTKAAKPVSEDRVLKQSQGHWDYKDEDGKVLYRTVRYPQGNSKRFTAYKPDGQGHWISGIADVRRVLYRLPELLAADPTESVYIPEGEKHVNRLMELGFVATCNPFGASKWKDEYSEHLKGRHVVILPDNDKPGQKHAQQVAKSLRGKAVSTKVLELPGLHEKGDIVDWFEAGHTPKELLALVEAMPEESILLAKEVVPYKQQTGIEEARKVVAKWLELPDLDVVDVILATVIANSHAGDPVWVLLVGPPSSAKSELLRALGTSPQVHRFSSLTGKTLISGHKDADGGMLFRVEDLSTLLLLDFGQVLSLHPNNKALVLQRLREVYDGYTKGDFGNTTESKEWKGKLGFLAGVTPAIEKYTSVGAELGDRFLQYEMRVPDPKRQALGAIQKAGQETNMRKEIEKGFQGALAASGDPTSVTLSEEVQDTLGDLSVLTTCLRSVVSRNRYTHSIDYMPQPEGPARFVKALVCLGKALAALHGEDSITRNELRIVAKVALACIPSRRKSIINALTNMDKGTTKVVGLNANIATKSSVLILEDLMYLGAVKRWVEEERDTAAFHWKLNAEIRSQWATANVVAQNKELPTQKQPRELRELVVGSTPSLVFAGEAPEVTRSKDKCSF